MGVAMLHFSSKSFRGDPLLALGNIKTDLGSFNGGSPFLVLVANPFVETPHGQNYASQLCILV